LDSSTAYVLTAALCLPRRLFYWSSKRVATGMVTTPLLPGPVVGRTLRQHLVMDEGPLKSSKSTCPSYCEPSTSLPGCTSVGNLTASRQSDDDIMDNEHSSTSLLRLRLSVFFSIIRLGPKSGVRQKRTTNRAGDIALHEWTKWAFAEMHRKGIDVQPTTQAPTRSLLFSAKTSPAMSSAKCSQSPVHW
jgi:hypothetical protein